LFSLFLLVLLILRAVGARQPPQLVGDTKLFVHYCRLLEERGKQTNLSLPLEFDNNRESPLWGKLLLLHHSVLGVLTSDILKNRVAAISIGLDGRSALEALFHDRYAKAPLIPEVDMGMQIGHTQRIARVSN
jgi:hypothetical protein